MSKQRAAAQGSLQALVRDAVHDLDTASDALGATAAALPARPSEGVGAPVTPAAAHSRPAIHPLADILVLPGSEPARTPAASPPGRRFLVRQPLPVTVFRTRHPVRLRRLGVRGHRASAADGLRRAATARVSVASWLVDPLSRDRAPGAAALVHAPAPAEPVPAIVVGPAAPAEPEVDTAAPETVTAEPAVTVLPEPEPELELEAEEDDEGTPEVSHRWRHRLAYVVNLVLAAALSFVLITCAVMIGAFLTGHRIEQVVTGSMVPTVPVGSLVVSERVPANQLTAGDVIVFPNPNNGGEVIVHRIYDLKVNDAGEVVIHTKGDANPGPDGWTVKRPGDAYADKARWVVPGGGTVAAWLRAAGFFGLIGLFIGCVLYVGGRVVLRILRDEPEEDEHAVQ